MTAPSLPMQELARQIEQTRGMLKQAEADMERAGNLPPDSAGTLWAAANARRTLAEQQLGELEKALEKDAERRQLAAAQRPAKEKAAAKQINAMEKDLLASRERVTTAVDAAIAALIEAHDAGAAHDTLVHSCSEQLRTLGLTIEPGGTVHDTGISSNRMIQVRIRVRGTWWAGVRGSDLINYVTRHANEVLHGRGMGGLIALPARSDDLLSAVKRLKPRTRAGARHNPPPAA